MSGNKFRRKFFHKFFAATMIKIVPRLFRTLVPGLPFQNAYLVGFRKFFVLEISFPGRNVKDSRSSPLVTLLA